MDLQNPPDIFLDLADHFRPIVLLGNTRPNLDRPGTQTDFRYGDRHDVNGNCSRAHQNLSDCPSPSRRHDGRVTGSNLALDHASAIN